MFPGSWSVVIPAYNAARWICEAVDSVLAQTVVPEQVLVIDDGSTDATRQQLARYGQRIEYIHQANAGVAAARNHGLRRATGQWIAFLDADDLWHPRKVQLQRQALAEHPEIVLLGTRVFGWPAAFMPDVPEAPLPPLVEVPWERLVMKNHFTASSVVVRRDVLDRVGEFDTAMQGPEDYDLWLRVAEVGRVANLPVPLTGYRLVPGSVSRQPQRMVSGMMRILDRMDQRGTWEGHRLLRRKSRGYFHHICAYHYIAAGHYRPAVAHMMRSFASYPLPYRRQEMFVRLERPQRLVASVLRWAGLMGPDRGIILDPQAPPVVCELSPGCAKGKRRSSIIAP